MNPNLRRLWLLPLGLVLALAVAACSTTGTDTGFQKKGGPLTGHEVADADNDGAYIQAGPITYQLQISRLMNPWGVEDSQYLKGLPKGMTPYNLTPSQLWYGVFLWAVNQHHRPYTTSDRFVIEDTNGDVYHPVKLNAAVNPYAWTANRLNFGETEPGQDSTAANGFTGGKLILFRLPDSIYENRPLTLYVLSPTTGRRIGEISLDL